MKTISNEGLNLIKSFEGCRLIAYDDLQPTVTINSYNQIKGTLTIGFGHTADVRVGQAISQKQAENLLRFDLVEYEAYVNNPNYVPLTEELNQNQFDALVSFCYNCGQGSLKNLCHDRGLTEIAIAILQYNKSKGTMLAGLVRRREAEKELFEKVVVDNMEQFGDKLENNTKRIDEMEEIVKKIIIGLTQVSDKLAELPAPDWFVKEFPDALTLLTQKTGTNDFWRAFTLALRILKK